MAHQTDIFVKDILAAVGEIMLRWGFLETAMLDAVVGAPRSGILQAWQETARPSLEILNAIRSAAEVRHLLAHGLCGVDARPEGSGEAGVVCRDANGASIHIPLRRLHETAEELDRLRLAVREVG